MVSSAFTGLSLPKPIPLKKQPMVIHFKTDISTHIHTQTNTQTADTLPLIAKTNSIKETTHGQTWSFSLKTDITTMQISDSMVGHKFKVPNKDVEGHACMQNALPHVYLKELLLSLFVACMHKLS